MRLRTRRHGLLGRALRIAARYRYSLALAVPAAGAFLHLASEIAEGELSGFDAAATAFFAARRGSCDAVMFGLTWFGAFGVLASACGVIALLFAAARRRREAVHLVVCTGGAMLLCTALKLAFQRARPDAALSYFIATPATFSFPSGHAMAIGGFTGGLVVLVFVLTASRVWRAAALVLGLALAAGVAASRVYFGVHYPSDVIGGLLASAAWVAGVTAWFFPPERAPSTKTALRPP